MIRWVKIMVDLPSPEVVKDNPIVVVKNQNLSNEELVKFASTLGRVWDDSQFSGLQQTIQRGNSVEDSSVVNVSHDGALKRINVPWHVDLSHYPIQVLPNRLLYSIEEKNPTPTIFFNSSIALIRRIYLHITWPHMKLLGHGQSNDLLYINILGRIIIHLYVQADLQKK